MKILIITHEYPPVGGGGANACLNLTREYAAMGHEVTVVTVWFSGLPEEERHENVHIIRLKARRKHIEHCNFPEMLDYLWKAMIRASALQKRERFDICQAFFAIPAGPVACYLKLRYGLPYLIRFGGGDIPGFQERFRLLYKALGPFEAFIWKQADALIANSRGLKKLALDFYDKKEIRIITNGVDTSHFHPSYKKGSKGGAAGIELLFVSRLIERKGLQYILPMLPELQREAKKPLHLTVVGDGPYRRELEKIAADMALGSCVTFVGQKKKEELPAYYQAADIFILPSRKEGMPNVVLEAMASGLPIVMTPCEGSEELIGDNGYAAPVEQFQEKLLALCVQDEERRRMGEASLRLVEERFQWKGIAGQYTAVMEAILKKRADEGKGIR